MLIGVLAASILRNTFAGRRVIRTDEGRNTAGQNFKCRIIP